MQIGFINNLNFYNHIDSILKSKILIWVDIRKLFFWDESRGRGRYGTGRDGGAEKDFRDFRKIQRLDRYAKHLIHE